jgi:hypothetical protein
VREVHDLPVQLDHELRHFVEPALCGPPVEAVAPMVDDVTKHPERHAVVPVADAEVIRPSGPVQTHREIGQGRIADVNGVGRDVHGGVRAADGDGHRRGHNTVVGGCLAR